MTAARIKKLAKLLESAVGAQNASAEAMCKVAAFLDECEGLLGHDAFDVAFGSVTKLAAAAIDGKPDFIRAASDLADRLKRAAKERSEC